MKKSEKTRAIILLIILIAIGGVVMYGGATPPSQDIEIKPTIDNATPR